MRVVAVSAVVVLCVASLAAGCADSEQGMDGADATKRLAVEDLRPLVTLSPNATGWRWDVEPQTHLRTPAPLGLDESEPSYAIQKTLFDAYVDAGLVTAAMSSWFDTANMQKASSFAYLVATPETARTALDAENEFAHHWFPRVRTPGDPRDRSRRDRRATLGGARRNRRRWFRRDRLEAGERRPRCLCHLSPVPVRPCGRRPPLGAEDRRRGTCRRRLTDELEAFAPGAARRCSVTP